MRTLGARPSSFSLSYTIADGVFVAVSEPGRKVRFFRVEN